MAIGTITNVSAVGQTPSAPTGVHRMSFAGDASYPTNGTAAFEASVRAIIGGSPTIVGISSEDCGAYRAVYDRTADKLKVYQNSDGAEVANATNLSGTTFVILVFTK